MVSSGVEGRFSEVLYSVKRDAVDCVSSIILSMRNHYDDIRAEANCAVCGGDSSSKTGTLMMQCLILFTH